MCLLNKRFRFMKYIRTNKATDWRKREGIFDKIVQFVFSLVPNANPRYKYKYYRLNEWFIEFDKEGNAIREMGIDINGDVIFASPYKQNPGFWINSNVKISDFEHNEISSDQFITLWNKFFHK